MMNLKIISPLLIGFSLMSIYSQSVNAQSVSSKEPDAFQSNEKNPLYGNSGFNPMDLIHNANLFNGRSSADFAEDTNKELDNATSDFRKQQLQRMNEMQQQQEQPTTVDANNLTEPQ